MADEPRITPGELENAIDDKYAEHPDRRNALLELRDCRAQLEAVTRERDELLKILNGAEVIGLRAQLEEVTKALDGTRAMGQMWKDGHDSRVKERDDALDTRDRLAARVAQLEAACIEVLAHPPCSDPDCCKTAIENDRALTALSALLRDAAVKPEKPDVGNKTDDAIRATSAPGDVRKDKS